MLKKALLFISLYFLFVLVDAGLAATTNRFGEVYDLEGTVKIFSADGRVTNLKPGQDLFYPIKEGDRIEVQQGKVVIVSTAQKGYEIKANSVGTVRDRKLVTIKGTVSAKERPHAPSGGTAGAIGGTVIRSLNKKAAPVVGYGAVVSETAHQGQSTILDIEGHACMGDDKSRKQTEQAAISDARRRAAEYALTYLKSETQVNDFELEKDLVSAYSNAQVKVIQDMGNTWYKDPAAGDCCKVKVKAEVIPDEKAIKAASKISAIGEPNAPLMVTVWTDKKEYKKGDRVRIYVKGNKPFYARVLYRDTGGATLQLLPNPYQKENYFNGGSVNEIPSRNDQFDLEVTPPFGEENIHVYASTTPLGEIGVNNRGAVYQVKTRTNDIGWQTRGVQFTKKASGKPATAEFFEDKAMVKTGQ